jgi:hypothetical protein
MKPCVTKSRGLILLKFLFNSDGVTHVKYLTEMEQKLKSVSYLTILFEGFLTSHKRNCSL